MTVSDAVEVQRLVMSGDISGAVRTAEDAGVDAVATGLEYDVLDANAEAFDEFLTRWYAAAATPGRKLDIEAHARGAEGAHLTGRRVNGSVRQYRRSY